MELIAGPDPHPRKPRFTPPPLSCDAHCHVFGPAGKFPYAPDRSYTPPDAPKESLKALHDFLGIERAVIVQASCHDTDNRAALDAIATSEGRYRGIAIIDESFGDKDLRALDEGGIRGVRFNFVKHLGGVPDLDFFRSVVPRIAALGWHLVFHFDATDIPEYAEMLRGLPVPFVIDHMGRVKANAGVAQAPFQALLGLMQLETCWIKVCGPERVSTAGPPFYDAVPYAQALIAAAPGRILWGTDYPHPNVAKNMPNDGDLVDLLPVIAPDEAVRYRILVENPARLYGFPLEASSGLEAIL